MPNLVQNAVQEKSNINIKSFLRDNGKREKIASSNFDNLQYIQLAKEGRLDEAMTSADMIKSVVNRSIAQLHVTFNLVNSGRSEEANNYSQKIKLSLYKSAAKSHVAVGLAKAEKKLKQENSLQN
ncbi:MAG: hypothetical protein ACP5M9_03910 [Candidatus Micrarchaeia archaeon]